MTNTANTEYRDEPQGSSFTEHLTFVALLLPTFVVLAAAVVSLARPEPTIAVEKPIVTAAACEPCPGPGQDGDDGP
jgi:hypothetical protein